MLVGTYLYRRPAWSDWRFVAIATVNVRRRRWWRSVFCSVASVTRRRADVTAQYLTIWRAHSFNLAVCFYCTRGDVLIHRAARGHSSHPHPSPQKNYSRHCRYLCLNEYASLIIRLLNTIIIIMKIVHRVVYDFTQSWEWDSKQIANIFISATGGTLRTLEGN